MAKAKPKATETESTKTAEEPKGPAAAPESTAKAEAPAKAEVEKVPAGAKLDPKTGRVEAYPAGTFDPLRRKPQKA